MAQKNGLEKLVIEGGKSLNGEVIPAGNKNAVLPIICASVMGSEPVVLKNVPNILDVDVQAKIFEALGGKVERDRKKFTMTLDPSGINSHTIPEELGSKLRASNLFLGPVWARFKKVVGVQPGGDMIGPREMDAHYVVFEGLGGTVEDTPEAITITGELKGNAVALYEPSVTGSENAIMAAVMAKGTTILDNVAREPHVKELCNFLNDMGAKITGLGTSQLEIEGVNRLNGTEHEIWPDHVDVGTTVIMAAITKGEVRIKNVRHEEMKTILFFLKTLGVDTKADGADLIIPRKQDLKTQAPTWSRTKGIYCQPWPGFPADLMSQTIVLATQTEGTTLFFDKMYPGRMYFSMFLGGMGASIIMCDPHRIVVNGKAPLRAKRLIAPDIRAGMAYLLAALVAKGTSTVESVFHIDRGYPNIEDRLNKLGAKVKRINQAD